MKNTRYYPFERNRYFYGKLLTVRDFETEQKYFNDKRRLINRLLFGSGVICGLQVIAVDDKTVSVEAGVALDCSGREIVVASPVTQRLSMIEGFTNNENTKNIYLCLAYDEKGKEPVHSLAGATTGGNEDLSEYNRYQESYKLLIKEEDPDLSTLGNANIIEETQLVYSDGQIKLWQKTPRYVNPGETFEVIVRLEKTLQTPRVEFEYELACEHFQGLDGSSILRVHFSEPEYSQETVYNSRHLLRAVGEIPATSGRIKLNPNSFKLKTGEKQVGTASDFLHTIEIIEGSVNKKLIDNYFKLSLDQCLECGPDQHIYLAKISLLHMGPTFMIEKVENNPFGEYIYNTSLFNRLGLLDQGKKEQLQLTASAQVKPLGPDKEPSAFVNFDQESGTFNFELGLPRSKLLSENISTGTVEIELERNPKVGKSYISGEISHGLGTGPVYMTIGMEEAVQNNFLEMDRYSETIYLGAMDVFNKSSFEPISPPVATGVVIYPKAGTFRAGIKLQSGTRLSSLKLRWWAFKKPEDID